MQLRFEFRPFRSLERRLERGFLHPIDYLRRRGTRGLQVGAGDQEVRRGEELDARVTISSPGRLGEVEVGLICTEFYECDVSDSDVSDSDVSDSDVFDSDAGRSRGTSSATAHEAWLPVESTPGVQSVRLTVPAEAPFSYEGELLCFKWEVVARGRRKGRLDAQARHQISVLP
jgi:hypothetical protein